MKEKMKENGAMKSCGTAVLSVGLLLAVTGGAAESNAICYDGETTTAEYENRYPAYLTNGTLTVQLNWDSSLVPQGATKALLDVGSAAPCVSQRLYPRRFAEVSKPTSSLSLTLFDSETPPRDDDIRISLIFVSDDGTQTNAAYTTFCQLSKGSFGQTRVLTVATDSPRWTKLMRPLDMHIESAWLNVGLTYASVSNLTDGACYQGVYPFDGSPRETGVLHLDEAFAGPGRRKNVRLFGGDIKYFDRVFHGGGLMLLVF